MVSTEHVDEAGRKVRINVDGHWADLNKATVAIIMAAMAAAGYGLSDYEDPDPAEGEWE